MPLSVFVFIAVLGICMVQYVRRALARAKQRPDPKAYGRRLATRGAFGLVASLVAGMALPVPDSLPWLEAARTALFLACVLSSTWLLAGIGVMESDARRREG